MDDKKHGRIKRKIGCIIICAAAVAHAVLLYMQIGYEVGSFYFGPKIKGSVTLRSEAGDAEYSFEAAEGRHGYYEWTVGTDDVPIDISLFNKNDWQTTRLNLTVVQSGEEWLITGKVSSNRFGRRTYENRIPIDERIRIYIEFY